MRCGASLLTTPAEPAHKPECATRNREHRQQPNPRNGPGNADDPASEGYIRQAE